MTRTTKLTIETHPNGQTSVTLTNGPLDLVGRIEGPPTVDNILAVARTLLERDRSMTRQDFRRSIDG
jgi:hypothetical protein